MEHLQDTNNKNTTEVETVTSMGNENLATIMMFLYRFMIDSILLHGYTLACNHENMDIAKSVNEIDQLHKLVTKLGNSIGRYTNLKNYHLYPMYCFMKEHVEPRLQSMVDIAHEFKIPSLDKKSSIHNGEQEN